MRILVVHPGSGWILSHVAHRMCEAAPENFTAAPMPRPGVQFMLPPDIDGIYLVDVQNCVGPPWREFYPNALQVGFFTHVHENDPRHLRENWRTLDGVVQMSQRYYDMFLSIGFYPPDRMTVLRPGEVSHFPLKKTKIGICQRGEHVGKGRDFLPEVIKSLRPEVRDCIELHFKGKGWDDAFEHKAFRGATFFGGEKPEEWFSGSYYGVSAFSYASEDAKSYPGFYAMLDYFLLPSLWEAGTMAVLEALATGLPIISSEVGWVPEFKRVAHLYPAGCVDALAIILTEIAERRLLRRAEVEGMSYRKYAEGVLRFFEKLQGIK